MTIEYCDLRVYTRTADADRIVTALDEVFASEGMCRVAVARLEPSRFEPERSNTWSVAIAPGVDGWHALAGWPVPLFSGPAAGSPHSRFEALAKKLAAPSFLIQIYDGGTQAQLIIESLAGRIHASGYITDNLAEEFYGRLPLPEEAFDLWKFVLQPELQTIINESTDWNHCQVQADQADVRAFLHLGNRLLGQPNADALLSADLHDAQAELRPYAHPAVRVLYYEWPAGDRIDSQGRPRDWAAWALDLGLSYADGTPMLKHDEVLADGVTEGTLRSFVGLSPFVRGGVSVAVEVAGESGYRMFRPKQLQLLRRTTSRPRE